MKYGKKTPKMSQGKQKFSGSGGSENDGYSKTSGPGKDWPKASNVRTSRLGSRSGTRK